MENENNRNSYFMDIGHSNEQNSQRFAVCQTSEATLASKRSHYEGHHPKIKGHIHSQNLSMESLSINKKD